MKKSKSIRIPVFVFLLSIASALYAHAPVQDMTRLSLGLEYAALFRGQVITKQKVPSHENIHLISLQYAPVPYLLFKLGGGAEKFTVDEYQGVNFDGNYGFAPTGAISLFSPFFADRMLRVTAGMDFVYFKSEDDLDNIYSGFALNPCGGLIFSAGKRFDIELGAKGHIIAGQMEDSLGSKYDFSNRYKYRGYCRLTLHSPLEGAYISVQADASHKIDADFSSGPYEATIGISLGFILTPDRKNKIIEDENIKYFPAHKELQEKQDDMADEMVE
jgi:hypothetical protein